MKLINIYTKNRQFGLLIYTLKHIRFGEKQWNFGVHYYKSINVYEISLFIINIIIELPIKKYE